MSDPAARRASVLLLDIATSIGLMTALVYVAGWTYAYHYFGYFRLGLLQLEIPQDYLFMYGFWVLKEWFGWLLMGYGVACAVVWWVFSHRPGVWQWLRGRPLLLKHVQVLAVLGAFVVIWWLAVQSASGFYGAQRETGFAAYPEVRVYLRDAAEDGDLGRIHAGLAAGDYRLLLQNAGKLFLFRVPRPVPPFLQTLEISLDDVQMLRVKP